MSRSFAPVRVVFACVLALLAARASAQERAYFSTYDHYLGEAGNLELAVATTTRVPKYDQSVYTAPCWNSSTASPAGGRASCTSKV